MLLYTLPFCLGILVFIEYFFIFKRKLSNPSILFTSGFFLCALFLTYFEKIWLVKLHEETFILVLGGNIAFLFGALVIAKKTNNEMFEKKYQLSESFFPVLTNRLKLLFIFQICNALLKVYLLSRYYGLGSIGANLFAHTLAMKSGDEDIMKFPIGLGFISNIIDIAASITPILLGLYITKRKRCDDYSSFCR